ncbi:MAG: glycosyl hydrolase 115 family protein [Xanthomonadales bacterium]|nr:glycosyl hydrolase 115 family protein [Xanthomonadales bacterium]
MIPRKILTGLFLSFMAGVSQAETFIVTDPSSSDTARHAAAELAADIRHACPSESVAIRSDAPSEEAPGVSSIRIGHIDNGPLFADAAIRVRYPLLEEKLEPETFVIQSSDGSAVIAGADDRGLLYAVYEFSARVLGIDPLEFWTGKKPSICETLKIPPLTYRAPAPVFSLRGYFDNDNDHLANWRGRKLIVEFDTWKQMIDSLARLRYNYIDIHDLLGRPEYYLRDYYTQMTDYHTDLELVEQVIDYAHLKGMLVQIPMSLGWEFRHIGLDQVCLTEHFDLWMETYAYYLSETPLGKADLFLVRPRHPIYDWEYKCPSEEEQGIPHGPLLQRMITELDALIQRYRPAAQLVTDLWQEGRPLWTSGEFSPDKDIQVLWADAGYAEFGGWPSDPKGYAMGIYIHAGVWHNQVVQDPYPARLARAFRDAAARGMTNNALVNGQSFKPFILNLEAAALAMWNPDLFDPEQFYRDWTRRYFGPAASEAAVQSFKRLHAAHQHIPGYRDVTKASQKILRALSEGKAAQIDIGPIRAALSLAKDSLSLALEAKRNVPPDSLDVFDDQLGYPVKIYVQNLELLESLADLNNALLQGKKTTDLAATARQRVRTLLNSLTSGSRWKKWDGWYLPENFRVHTPPVTLDDFDHVFGR